MAYTQPSPSAVNFDLTTGYSQPSPSAVNFELTEVTYSDATVSSELVQSLPGSVDTGVRGSQSQQLIQSFEPDFYTSGVTTGVANSLTWDLLPEVIVPVFVTAPLSNSLVQSLSGIPDDHTAALSSQQQQTLSPNLGVALTAPISDQDSQNLAPDWFFVFVVNAPLSEEAVSTPTPFAKRLKLDLFGIDEQWTEWQSGDHAGVDENWIELQSGDINTLDEQWTELQSGNIAGFNESWAQWQSGDKFDTDEKWVERQSGDQAGVDENWVEVQSGNVFNTDELWRQLVWANTERTFTYNALVSPEMALSQSILATSDSTYGHGALVNNDTGYSSRALLSPAWQVQLPSLVTVIAVGTETTLSDRPFTAIFSTAADEYNRSTRDVVISGSSIVQPTPAISASTMQDAAKDVIVSTQADEYNKLTTDLIASQNGIASNDVVVSITSMQDVRRDLAIALSADQYNKITTGLIVASVALLQQTTGVSVATLQQRIRDLTLTSGAQTYNIIRRVVTLSGNALLSHTTSLSLDTRSSLESTLVLSSGAQTYNSITTTLNVSMGAVLCNTTTISNWTLQPLNLDLVVASNALNYNALSKALTLSTGAINTLNAVVNYSTLSELNSELIVSLSAQEYNAVQKQIHVVQSALLACDTPIEISTLFDISTGLTLSMDALQYIGVEKTTNVSTGATIGDTLLFTTATLQPIYKVVISSESILTPVTKNIVVSTGANGLNPLSLTVTSTASTEPENIVISDFETYIIHKGTRYEIIDLVLRDGIDTYAWQGSLELAQPYAYQALKVGEDFDLYYFGQVFELMVEKRSLTRDNPVQPKLVIDVISRSARLAKPFNEVEINQTFTANKASVIANLITPVTWGLLDWVVKSGRFAVDNAAPLDALQSLVTAVGGMLETTRDSNLVAKPVFKTLPWEWSAGNADHELNDFEDNISYSESYERTYRYNRITISDSESRQWSIRSETDSKDPTKATIIVTSYPWCDSVELVHTSYPGIVIKPLGATAWSPRDDTNLYETIEFKENRASTQYPVFQINSYQYTHKDLGSMAFDIDTNEIRTNDTAGVEAGYSIARVHYITRDVRFSVSGMLPGETVQFLAIAEEN